MKRERYFSVDVESSGPIPGEYSMLSVGACVVGKPRESFYAELKPISENFVPAALEVSGFNLDKLRRDGAPLNKQLNHFEHGLKKLPEPANLFL